MQAGVKDAGYSTSELVMLVGGNYTYSKGSGNCRKFLAEAKQSGNPDEVV